MRFVDLLEKYGVPYREHGTHHHVTQGWLGIDCPFCSPGSGKFRMGYNLAGAFFSCWTCGSHSLWHTLRELFPLPSYQVVEVMRGLDREVVPEEEPTGELRLPSGCADLGRQHRDYLLGRGFDPDALARVWHLQGTTAVSSHPWRIVIPVTLKGRVVSWTARSISRSVRARYKNAPSRCEAVSAKKLLFGEDLVRHAIIVCEGPFDAFRIGPGAVATLGVAVSKEQIARISKYPVRAVCFDSEPAAQRRASWLCRQLECFPGATYNVRLDAKDPGSACAEEVAELRSRFLD